MTAPRDIYDIVAVTLGLFLLGSTAVGVWLKINPPMTRTPEENYALFLAECGKARFDAEQCVFLGLVGRVTGRPAYVLEGGE